MTKRRLGWVLRNGGHDGGPGTGAGPLTLVATAQDITKTAQAPRQGEDTLILEIGGNNLPPIAIHTEQTSNCVGGSQAIQLDGKRHQSGRGGDLRQPKWDGLILRKLLQQPGKWFLNLVKKPEPIILPLNAPGRWNHISR